MRQVSRTFCPTHDPTKRGTYMKKLHTFAVHALLTPAIALGAASAMAQQTTPQNTTGQQQGTQGGMQTSPVPMPTTNSTNRAGQTDMKATADRQNPSSQMQDYMNMVPADGIKASNLIGSKVNTPRNEDVGSISDLIIDKDGKVVAVVIGVGGFLGMGERDVAVGWSHIVRSGSADKRVLQIDVTKENLRLAPEFKK